MHARTSHSPAPCTGNTRFRPWPVFLAAALAMAAATPSGQALDQDGDGVSDVYANHYGLPAGSGASDGDGDGYNVWQEDSAGTDPNLASSRPTLTISVDPQADEVHLTFLTVEGKRYQLETTPNLYGWQDVGDPIFGGGPDPWANAVLAYDENAIRYFYRYYLLPDLDGDSDGLTGAEEALLGLDDTVEDYDGDTLLDGFEVAFGLDPTDDGSTDPSNGKYGDGDGDTLSNAEEQTLATSPLENDLPGGGSGALLVHTPMEN